MSLRVTSLVITYLALYFLPLSVSLAKELEIFPSGTDFQKIVNLKDRSHAWATCYAMDKALASRKNTEPTQSQQREKLAEATKLIIMMTLLDDPNLWREDQRNALSVVWTANKIVSERSSEYIRLMTQIQQELGAKEFAKNFNRTRRVCESNSIGGLQIVKDFEERVHAQDKKAIMLAEIMEKSSINWVLTPKFSMKPQ
ncbi:hypothetical protein [Arenicella xantha]|uniref:Uncharacterized protein n=1 Tax=Arenicella xantha TaxID=644221 RepID=A0A395JF59_9GAMM|nr:hypothetical protein [Arenicella xantha]RBP48273.1 hypothetical protein DFR28_1081 [Arenicella xantha]